MYQMSNVIGLCLILVLPQIPDFERLFGNSNTVGTHSQCPWVEGVLLPRGSGGTGVAGGEKTGWESL